MAERPWKALYRTALFSREGHQLVTSRLARRAINARLDVIGVPTAMDEFIEQRALLLALTDLNVLMVALCNRVRWTPAQTAALST